MLFSGAMKMDSDYTMSGEHCKNICTVK